jgi:hypothetical protein
MKFIFTNIKADRKRRRLSKEEKEKKLDEYFTKLIELVKPMVELDVENPTQDMITQMNKLKRLKGYYTHEVAHLIKLISIYEKRSKLPYQSPVRAELRGIATDLALLQRD